MNNINQSKGLTIILGFIVCIYMSGSLSLLAQGTGNFQKVAPSKERLNEIKPIIEEKYFKKIDKSKLVEQILRRKAYSPDPLSGELFYRIIKKDLAKKYSGKSIIAKKDASGNEVALVKKGKESDDKGNKKNNKEKKRIRRIFNKVFKKETKLLPEIIGPRWKKRSVSDKDKAFTPSGNNKKPAVRETLTKVPFKKIKPRETKMIPRNDKDLSFIKLVKKPEMKKEAIIKQDEKLDDKKNRTLARDLYDLNPEHSRLLARSGELFKDDKKFTGDKSTIERMRVLLKRYKYNDLIKLFKNIAKTSKEYPKAIFYRSLAYEYKRDYTRAIESYLELARDYPKNQLADDALRASAILYRRTGNTIGAINLLGEIIQNYSQGDQLDDAYYQLANIYEISPFRQNYRQAEKYYTRLLNNFGKGKQRGYSPYISASSSALERIRRQKETIIDF